MPGKCFAGIELKPVSTHTTRTGTHRHTGTHTQADNLIQAVGKGASEQLPRYTQWSRHHLAAVQILSVIAHLERPTILYLPHKRTGPRAHTHTHTQMHARSGWCEAEKTPTDHTHTPAVRHTINYKVRRADWMEVSSQPGGFVSLTEQHSSFTEKKRAAWILNYSSINKQKGAINKPLS